LFVVSTPEQVDAHQPKAPASLIPETRFIPLVKPLPVVFLANDDGSLAYTSQEGDANSLTMTTQFMKSKEINALHSQTTGTLLTTLVSYILTFMHL